MSTTPAGPVSSPVADHASTTTGGAVREHAIDALRALSERVLSEPRRDALLRVLRPLLYRGDSVSCPCCRNDFSRLVTHRGVPNVRCPSCGSMERHRLLWLYLQQRTDVQTRRYRVLHMAPEASIERILRRLPNIEYISADLDSWRADVHCDIQDLPFSDESFDIVICNHVLEHIPDDRGAMSELVRVMAPGAWAVLMCPIARQRAMTFEDPEVRTRADALRAYGQEDHVRLYGSDYRSRLEDAGLVVSVDRFLDDIAPEVIERYALRRTHDLFEEDDIYIGRKP